MPTAQPTITGTFELFSAVGVAEGLEEAAG